MSLYQGLISNKIRPYYYFHFFIIPEAHVVLGLPSITKTIRNRHFVKGNFQKNNMKVHGTNTNIYRLV